LNEEITTEVMWRSCLKRRRMSAAYACNISGKRKFWTYLIIFIMTGILFLTVFSLFSRPLRPAPQSVGLPLAEKTRVNKIERYYLEHEISEGDTIWKICRQYYGSWSPTCIARLREMNQWLPEKPEDLETSRVLRVPLR
jgi:hypothetical protein